MGDCCRQKGQEQGRSGPHLSLGTGRDLSPRQINSLVLTRKFQVEWFKITFLREIETIKLGIKSWVNTSDSILAFFLLNTIYLLHSPFALCICIPGFTF